MDIRSIVPRISPRWVVARGGEEAHYLASVLGLEGPAVTALWNRGLRTPEEIEAFLKPALRRLRDPFLMKDMDRAVERTKRAIALGEEICIYGDYDADGITSTALLLRFLRRLGAKVTPFLPVRAKDGYGLNLDRLSELRASGCTLFISVDCGTRSHLEASALKASGADLIILDHHTPDESLPEALALLNPLRPDCPFPFKGMASVGLAFYFVGALRRALIRDGLLKEDEIDLREFLDLVAIGTVSDVVPLVEENRILVHAGLRHLNENPSFGLRALKAVAGVINRPVRAGTIAFQIGPRLNASGRLSDPRTALELLLARDTEEAARHAAHLDRENRERQRLEGEMLLEALKEAQSQVEARRKVIVVAKEGFHPGVVGIVAAKLVEAFYRPSVVIGIENGIGRGSCRSVPGFDIGQAVTSLAPLLIKAGGHPMAAGLTIEADRIEAFRSEVNRICDEVLREEDLSPVLKIDGPVKGPEVTEGLLETIQGMEPFGVGNPEPVFCLFGATLKEVRRIGQGRHASFLVEADGACLRGVWWNAPPELEGSTGPVDVAFSLELDERSGLLRLNVRDIRKSFSEG